MKTIQEKVSLTIETDWQTFEFVDLLSKQLQHIEQSIYAMKQQTEQRLQDMRAWSMVDPTEWLEDVEEDLEDIEALVKKIAPTITEKVDELQKATKQQAKDTTDQFLHIESVMKNINELLTKVNGAIHFKQERQIEHVRQQEKSSQQIEQIQSDINRLEVKLDAMSHQLDHVMQHLTEEKGDWEIHIRQNLKALLKEVLVEINEENSKQLENSEEMLKEEQFDE